MNARLLAAAGAVSATALAVSVNLATDFRHSWIAWTAVGALTLATCAISVAGLAGPRKQASRRGPRGAMNVISGDVSGKAVQAETIEGDVNL